MSEECAKCEGCVQSVYMKGNKRSKAPLRIQPLKPILWQKVHVDLTGKLGPGDEKIILAIAIDRFSKYIFAQGNTI